MESHFFKRVNAQKLQSSVEASGQLQLLVKDGHHQVNAHRDPDLSLHRIRARPVVMLDAQVAFDPAEEEFDSPAQAVKLGHAQGGDVEVVGEKDKSSPGFLVVIAHLAKEGRKVRARFGELGLSDLVAEQAAGVIHRTGNLCRANCRFSLARVTKKAPARAIKWRRAKSM